MVRYFFTLLLICIASVSLGKPSQFGFRKDVQAFITKMHEKHQFNKKKLTALFNTMEEPSRYVVQRIQHPFEATPWFQYRNLFLKPDRIQQGVYFWKMHQHTLARAEKKFHVPASMIVAIIGIESKYGEYTGKFPVLNSLSTLSFNYSPRASFFQSELENFLLLCRERHMDPKEVYGSYAGAIGQPQFMPSSVREYAVDFSGNSKIDLSNSDMDVIGSVANYFHEHGWLYEQPIAKKRCINNLAHQNQIFDPLSHTFLRKKSCFRQLAKDSDRSLVVKLKTKNGSEYWQIYHNLAVIMKYNTSINYAMAAYALSKEINKQYHKKYS